MEVNFQNYVHGENRELYLGFGYMVLFPHGRDIRQTESDLARAEGASSR